jgi:hypothetical protein
MIVSAALQKKKKKMRTDLEIAEMHHSTTAGQTEPWVTRKASSVSLKTLSRNCFCCTLLERNFELESS